MNGLPPHIAQIIAGHRDLNVTLGYKAMIYPDEAIQAHLAFLALPARSSTVCRPVQAPVDDPQVRDVDEFDPDHNGDGTIRIFDAMTGARIDIIETGKIGGISITPLTTGDGGPLLAVVGNFPTKSNDREKVQIYDPVNMNKIGSLDVAPSMLNHYVMSAFTTRIGRSYLAIAGGFGGQDSTMQIFDPLAGTEVARVIPGGAISAFHTYQLKGINDSYDTFLAVGGNSGVSVFNITDEDL
jgi:hypothetical protein